MENLTLTKYRHSGKFGLPGWLGATALAAAATLPLGFVYAYLIKWIPFVYANALLTAGYGLACGYLVGRLLKRAHVRNAKIALLSGLLVGVVALYANWNGHVHALISGAPWVCSLEGIWAIMQLLYEQGSWGLRHGGNVTGVFLAIVWAVEAGCILFFSVTMPGQFISGMPYCEKTRRWLDQSQSYDTLEALGEPAALAALQEGNITPLLDAKPRPADARLFTRVVLKHSPQCQTFCTLQVQQVTLTPEKDGKLKEDSKEVSADLVLPHDMLETVRQFVSQPAPAPTPAA